MEKNLKKQMTVNMNHYRQARKLENVNYISYKERSFIQKNIYRYHMFLSKHVGRNKL